MDSPPETEIFIPKTVGGVLRMLDRIADVSQLSARQKEAIYTVLHVRDSRTVEERVEAGDLALAVPEKMVIRQRKVEAAKRARAGRRT